MFLLEQHCGSSLLVLLLDVKGASVLLNLLPGLAQVAGQGRLGRTQARLVGLLLPLLPDNAAQSHDAKRRARLILRRPLPPLLR